MKYTIIINSCHVAIFDDCHDVVYVLIMINKHKQFISFMSFVLI